MKLLSPAGNFESLKAAVYNGADEIYLGVNEFNARNNIDGFTLDTLSHAVSFAHVYGVKVHLAINILFSDSELSDALSLAVKAVNLGVDALIIQDLGLAKLLNDYYPEIEKHASTQMGIHNLEGVKAIESLGFKRVVLSRETPLEEIKRIKDNSSLEIEYFAHGALCVSFSGNCYLSSYEFGASGNRGRCKQLCRLPYTLYDNDKKIKSGYLLSAKDFNMISRLNDLKAAGVDAIKIEGRARRAFYVGAVTAEYRRALDGKKYSVDKLALAFNRRYTEGYFGGNGKIISDVQSHIGIEIGEVYKVNNGRNFNEIYFTSNRKLLPKCALKTYSDGKECAVLTAFDLRKITDGKYLVTTTNKISVGEKVRIITDPMEEELLAKVVKKRAVDLSLELVPEKPIKAEFKLHGKTYTVVGEVLQSAKNQPLTMDEIKDNFAKNEYFVANITVNLKDGVFIRKQSLNAFRRDVFEKLYSVITEKYKRDLKIIDFTSSKEIAPFSDFVFTDCISSDFKQKNVIYSPEFYVLENVKKFKALCEKSGKCAYLDMPNFALEKDIIALKDIIKETGIGVVANNYYALNFSPDTVIGAGLNVFNKESAAALNKPYITAEAEMGSRIDFPLMTLRHCPIKSHVGAKCSDCKYKDGYKLKMENGKVMKLKRKKLSTCTFYLTY